MTYNYTPITNKATALIKKFGLPCKIQYANGATISCYGVKVNDSKQNDNTFDVAMLTENKINVIISQVKTKVLAGDTLIWNKKNYKIEVASPVEPTDVNIITEIQASLL